MKEESSYYVEKNDVTFIYKHILDKLEAQCLELKRKLFGKEISIEDFKEANKPIAEIIFKATKFVETKMEFLEIYAKYKFPEKFAKQQWKHEREHFIKNKEEGLTPTIGITHIVEKENSGVGLKPMTRDNLFESTTDESLEKAKKSQMNILDVTELSESDKKQVELLKNSNKQTKK